MGLFGGASPCESDVEKATNEKNTSEEWGFIMEVCDKAGKSPQEAKDYLKAILKRINNPDPHIAIQAVTLLDACVKNCGRLFHIEVASRDFENEYMKLMKKCHSRVTQKLREALKRWSENEFKTDQQLNLIPSLYNKLKNTGYDFTPDEPKRQVTISKDPNVVQSQEEAEQIAKAIELSLKETSGSPKSTAATTTTTMPSSNTTSLYPSANMAMAAAPVTAAPAKELKKVRALYDFEAAEDNELTFTAGEIIVILDDSDPNWWKGSNQRGEGLFPANFVTNDLNVDADQLLQEKNKILLELDESLDKKLEEMKDPENIEIDETKIDRLLHLLHEADPTNPEQDTKEMLGLEKEVNAMGGLIDKELEKVDRKHAQLTQLSSDLVEALNLYHTLMREPQYPSVPMNKMPYGYPQTPQPPPNMVFNGAMQHQQHPPSMVPPQGMMSFNPIQHPQERFMPPQGPPGIPPFSLPPQGMHPPGSMQPPPNMGPHGPMSMPPMNAPPQSMPPVHAMQMPGPPPPNMPQEDPRLTGQFPPQGYNPMSFPGQHLRTAMQNGPPGPQNGAFSMPSVSNSHIM